jgi:hypothetical protein
MNNSYYHTSCMTHSVAIKSTASVEANGKYGSTFVIAMYERGNKILRLLNDALTEWRSHLPEPLRAHDGHCRHQNERSSPKKTGQVVGANSSGGSPALQRTR